MKFLSVRELRAKSASVWHDLPAQGEMVVTSNGHPVAILTAVDENSLESSLAAVRRARAAEAVTSIQRRSVELGLDRLSMADLDAEIRATRKKRAP